MKKQKKKPSIQVICIAPALPKKLRNFGCNFCSVKKNQIILSRRSFKQKVSGHIVLTMIGMRVVRLLLWLTITIF